MQLIVNVDMMGVIKACKGNQQKIRTLMSGITDGLTRIADAFDQLEESHNLKGTSSETANAAKETLTKPTALKEPKPTEIKLAPNKITAPKESTKEGSEKEEKPKTVKVKCRTAEQQEAINSIKEAWKKLRNDEKQKQDPAQNRQRLKIDDTLIVTLKDNYGKSFKTIAKEIGCCEQTVINHYNKAKEGKR